MYTGIRCGGELLPHLYVHCLTHEDFLSTEDKAEGSNGIYRFSRGLAVIQESELTNLVRRRPKGLGGRRLVN